MDSPAASLNDFKNPEQEMAEKGAGVAPAAELAIEDINPLNAHLFHEHRWHDYFARLRAEDPVHFNELEKGGHFAAFEQPETWVNEVRTSFRSLR